MWTFQSAISRITFYRSQFTQSHVKDMIALLVTSLCVYQLKCQCGAKYICQANRQIREHCRARLAEEEMKNTSSTVIEHLANCTLTWILLFAVQCSSILDERTTNVSCIHSWLNHCLFEIWNLTTAFKSSAFIHSLCRVYSNILSLICFHFIM